MFLEIVISICLFFNAYGLGSLVSSNLTSKIMNPFGHLTGYL
jgi:hypothetical protein